MRLELRCPATAEKAPEHARVAVELFAQEFERELDFSPRSLEDVDGQLEQLREEGHTAEDLAEALFSVGCYLGEVLARTLGGRWRATRGSLLEGLSPWPMVLTLPDGTTWDAIGKVFRRFEVGESEYLPAFFAAAARRLG
jgi:hypothetical protein